MRKFSLAVILAAHCAAPAWAANEFAPPKDAEVLVAKVVKALSIDKDATVQEINGKDKKWVHLDSYPTVYTLQGICLANGQNNKLAGKDLIDLEDADGKAFIRERMRLAQSQGKFWQDYKFTDPLTKKVLPKAMYCEKTGDMVVCSGVYKR